MIDSGTPKNGEKIEKVLLKNNIDPHKIKYIILTHAHYDHVGNAKYFQTKFKSKIIVGKGDAEMIKNKGEDKHLCPTNLIAKIGHAMVKNISYESFTPDLLIEKEFNLNSIGFTGKIIPLSGHTKGSIIITSNQNVFTGDLIRGSLLKNTTPKRHFFMCDLEDNNTDIKYVTNISNIKTWYVGHGGPLTKKDVVEFLNKK